VKAAAFCGMKTGMPRVWHSQPADDLPDGLVLFDGVCVLCSGWVHFIIARDPAARYRFGAIQTPFGRRLAARFGINPENPQTNAVISAGRAHFKLESALVVVKDFPGWRWTRIAYLFPKAVRDFCYDRIARNRYTLFGRHDTCLVPTPDTMRRFLSQDPPGAVASR
jgi:predicted DCC family thiol-disulfide oxidoreductase YuxK